MDCAESLLLHGLFSGCSSIGLVSSCGTRASLAVEQRLWSMQASTVAACRLSSCSSQALEHRLQWLWCSGLVAPQHMGSSPTRDWTHVSRIGRWILYYWATGETTLCIWSWDTIDLHHCAKNGKRLGAVTLGWHRYTDVHCYSHYFSVWNVSYWNV